MSDKKGKKKTAPAKPAPKTGLKAMLKSVFKPAAAKEKQTTKPAPKAAIAKPVSKTVVVAAKVAKPLVKTINDAKDKKIKTKVQASAKSATPVSTNKETGKNKKTEPASKAKKGAAKTTMLSNTASTPNNSLKKAISNSFISKRRSAADQHAGMGVCREVACELVATTGGYCRMHYIKNWKKVKRKELILREKKLNIYIEELVAKYPDKYIEAIRQDLASEKDFAKVIADLEIDEGLDDFEAVETESAEAIIDNIKRDFDDEGDTF